MNTKSAFRHEAIAFSIMVAGFMFLLATPVQAQNDFPPPPAETSVLVGSGAGSPIDAVSVSPYAYDPGASTHPLLRLTPDKSEIVRVSAPVRSLVVGNPAHLNILLDSSRTLILVPREPGATHFTALGDDGQIIMQRHVIVGSPQKKYMRIRRSCANAGGGGCQETSVYYCPDMCHPVSIMSADQGQPAVSAAGNSSEYTVQITSPVSDSQDYDDEQQ